MKKLFIKSAILGSIILSLFYYVVLFLVTRDPLHPFTQFAYFQPWMSILIIGFGVQVGFYFLLRKGFRLKLPQAKETKLVSGTGGAVSGVSMIACCAHHVADITPILGLTGASIFLTEYQKELLILGVFFNLLGILYMGWLISGKRRLGELLQYKLRKEGVLS